VSAAFLSRHRASQGDYFSTHHAAESDFRNSPYRLQPDLKNLNLAPGIRELATCYFAEKGIAWHMHANHGLSSQVCCVNFLMPLAFDPKAISRVVGQALGIQPPEMLPMETDSVGRDWFVAFEWIGQQDYLNEAPAKGARTRGANATSTDAAVRFRVDGRIEIALIEWKFGEVYGAPISVSGNATRLERYGAITFAPAGPVRSDLGLALEDFFWEPFYQMVRQQMLATGMEKARELGAERVRVLHISPAGNSDLHAVTAPALRRFGSDAFHVFRSLLVNPDDFVCRSIEEVFAPLLDRGPSPWADYLRLRYPLFCIAPKTIVRPITETAE
jgi:hypothetical protein